MPRTWSLPSVSVRVASIAVVMAFAAAIVLRFWHINRFGFNSDEAVYAGQGGVDRRRAGAPALLPDLPRPPAALPDDPLGRPFALGRRRSLGPPAGRSVRARHDLHDLQAAALLYGRSAGLIAAR